MPFNFIFCLIWPQIRNRYHLKRIKRAYVFLTNGSVLDILRQCQDEIVNPFLPWKRLSPENSVGQTERHFPVTEPKCPHSHGFQNLPAWIFVALFCLRWIKRWKRFLARKPRTTERKSRLLQAVKEKGTVRKQHEGDWLLKGLGHPVLGNFV